MEGLLGQEGPICKVASTQGRKDQGQLLCRPHPKPQGGRPVLSPPHPPCGTKASQHGLRWQVEGASHPAWALGVGVTAGEVQLMKG